MSKNSFEAWENFGRERRMELLESIPEEFHENELEARKWLSEQTGIPLEGIPGSVRA